MERSRDSWPAAPISELQIQRETQTPLFQKYRNVMVCICSAQGVAIFEGMALLEWVWPSGVGVSLWVWALS